MSKPKNDLVNFYFTKTLSTDNFKIEIFTDSNYKTKYYISDEPFGWIEFIHKPDLCLDWDNITYFRNLDKLKKEELKEDVWRNGIHFKGWFKELKNLMKLAEINGFFK